MLMLCSRLRNLIETAATLQWHVCAQWRPSGQGFCSARVAATFAIALEVSSVHSSDFANGLFYQENAQRYAGVLRQDAVNNAILWRCTAPLPVPLSCAATVPKLQGC